MKIILLSALILLATTQATMASETTGTTQIKKAS